MTQYDYKVVPAPRRAKKIRGIKGTEELFAHTLTDAINEVARQGWEYVRAEHLPAEGPRGWFRSAAAGEQTVLVFRGASVLSTRTPVAPKKGNAWPLAWQTSEVQTISATGKVCK